MFTTTDHALGYKKEKALNFVVERLIGRPQLPAVNQLC